MPAGRVGPSRFEVRANGRDIVLRSLITLKALTHFETGGIVAAATTSLPERLGGTRNWDYRYCWLRDAHIDALRLDGIELRRGGECLAAMVVARRRRQSRINCRSCTAWRANAGSTNGRSPGCPAMRNSTPVRIGNAASGQVQLDVYGEVMDALYLGRQKGLTADHEMWGVQREMIAHLAEDLGPAR